MKFTQNCPNLRVRLGYFTVLSGWCLFMIWRLLCHFYMLLSTQASLQKQFRGSVVTSREVELQKRAPDELRDSPRKESVPRKM